MKFLEKLQNLPEGKRKIILWIAVIIIGFSLFVWWIKIVQKNLKKFQKEEFKGQLQLPSLEEELKKMPKIEIPEFETPEMSEEELKKLEEMIREIE